MDGYWVVHLKVDATITELDFGRDCHHIDWAKDSWRFQRVKEGETLTIIPKENILYVEWREER